MGGHSQPEEVIVIAQIIHFDDQPCVLAQYPPYFLSNLEILLLRSPCVLGPMIPTSRGARVLG
jgi:hypothetical protein